MAGNDNKQPQPKADDDPLGLKNGEANRKGLVAKSLRDAEAKKKSENILMKMAKFSLSSITGNIIAQEAATAIVTATSGQVVTKGAQIVSSASAAETALEYMPGGEYAKIAMGKKLGKVDTLALLGQHGGRELAKEEGKPLKQGKTASKRRSKPGSKKSRSGAAAPDIPQKELRRGWAADRSDSELNKNNETEIKLEPKNIKSQQAGSKIEIIDDKSKASAAKETQTKNSNQPGTHLENEPMTADQIKSLHDIQERERDKGIEPY